MTGQSPGFFGKLPSTGDFVHRCLPAAFRTAWDRWLSRHLHRLPDGAAPIYFRFAGYSGVVLPSRDRAGRRFPLTIAVAGEPSSEALDTLALCGAAAVEEALTADAFAARLAALPVMVPADGPALPDGLLLWTPPNDPRPVDPENPGAALAAVIGKTA